jgi:hypothetical protein
MQQLRNALRYYGSLLRPMFSDFRSRWEAVVFWLLLVVAVIGYFNQPVVRALSLSWQALPPEYGLALGLALLVFSFGRVNYKRIVGLEGEIARFRLAVLGQKAASAEVLWNDVVTIDRVTLPLTQRETGLLSGKSLVLRFTNVGGAPLTIRCRLLELSRLLPNAEWEPQDWFRETWLRWMDSGTEERLVPGASRDCEIASQEPGFAASPAPGKSLARTLLAGEWRATIDVEAGPYAARRVVVRYMWRPKAEPYSPGEAFVWLGTDVDTGIRKEAQPSPPATSAPAR